MIITRAIDAVRVNEISNDPSIYPWIRGAQTEPLDLSAVVANKNNVILVAEHGCVLFIKIQEGIYEFHTSVLPAGRGVWMQEAAASAFRWMFTKTDAYELVTKCPDGNTLAKLGARNVGCIFNFRTGPIWPADGRMVPVDVYGMMIQHWVINAPGLENTGHWFHESLISQYALLNKEIDVVADDNTHDRYVGAAVEMMRGGQALKAVSFYNRWAVMAGYKPISVLSLDPLTIDICEAKIRVLNDSFEVMK